MDGTPLLPCSNARGRLLLREGKAKVVSRFPFVIKLNYFVESVPSKELVLKVDTGSSNVGVAVCDEEGSVYFMGEVKLRNDIKTNMDRRRMYRRNRRKRNCRYRKPRFLNRANSKREGRLSPTLVSKVHSHVKIIEFLKKILPITQLVFETTDIDIHAIDHPEVLDGGGRKYQQSRIDGFENTKAYVRKRDNYTCQNTKCPNKKKDNVRLEVHHIQFRSQRGSDKPDNLVTLCSDCHSALHSGSKSVKFSKAKKSQSSKGATQVNIISNKLMEIYPDAKETFGYITKANRKRLDLDKTHYFDAVAIANQSDKTNFMTSDVILFKCIADGDYQMAKGSRSQQKICVRKICGFRTFDKVLYKGKIYFIKGKMSTGYAILADFNGKAQKTERIPKFSLMKRLTARKTWMTTKL